jgi:glycosyltransferase involved in cell wall biosynthesis
LEHKGLNLLMIGPLPPPFGGATVSFKYQTDLISQRDDVEAVIISTSDKAGQSFVRVRRVLRVFYTVIRNLRKVDVISLHLSTSSLPLVGSVVSCLTRLWKQPLIIYKFGGNDYHDYKGWRRWLTKWALQNADIYLAQTKSLVSLAKGDGISHVKWFPNSRLIKETKNRSPGDTKCRRFVFVSQVCKDKGIEEIIEAGERFDKDITIDIYGPLCDDYTEETFSGLKRIKYKGALRPEKVLSTLAGYDAFLLPTFHNNEGYSGAIIEAYLVGLPVICTRWRALPEIADDSCAILIEPHSSDELYEAMKTLIEDDQLWHRLCEGALAKRELFNIDRRIDEFVGYCQHLADGGNFKDK